MPPLVRKGLTTPIKPISRFFEGTAVRTLFAELLGAGDGRATRARGARSTAVFSMRSVLMRYATSWLPIERVASRCATDLLRLRIVLSPAFRNYGDVL